MSWNFFFLAVGYLFVLLAIMGLLKGATLLRRDLDRSTTEEPPSKTESKIGLQKTA